MFAETSHCQRLHQLFSYPNGKRSEVFMKLATTACVSFFLNLSAAHAEICDYRPSSLIGESGETIVSVTSGGASSIGAAMKSLGLYSLVHSTSGLTMLGSTAAGTSGAGTVGIIAGTGGVIGSIGATLMSPIVIGVGAATSIAVISFETVCKHLPERVTDYSTVLALLQGMADRDDKLHIWESKNGLVLAIVPDRGETRDYEIERLYFSNGDLMYRDFGPNTNLGPFLSDLHLRSRSRSRQ